MNTNGVIDCMSGKAAAKIYFGKAHILAWSMKINHLIWKIVSLLNPSTFPQATSLVDNCRAYIGSFNTNGLQVNSITLIEKHIPGNYA